MPSHGAPAPIVVAYAPRERTRAWLKRIAGKRLGRLVLLRTLKEFAEIFRTELVDAALVDVGVPDGGERAVTLALEYPSVGFVALTSLRPADGPLLSRCAELEVADILVEGVDDVVLRELVARHG